MHAVALPEGRRKSVGFAYALWMFFGLLGLHRLYLGHVLSAAGMAAITLVSLPLVWSGLGLLGLVAAGSWALADALLIPGMTKSSNEAAMAAAAAAPAAEALA
jgi:TM2 domain-containing membrane protein YozV